MSSKIYSDYLGLGKPVVDLLDMTNLEKKSGLEEVYNFHHTVERGDFFLVLGAERGAFLKEKIGKGKRVLDIGCRDGALTKFYAAGNMVLGLDIDEEALIRAKESLGIEVKHTDLNGAWEVPVNSFDVVVAAEVIEHLYYPEHVLEKIHEVLNPGGFLVGSIPHAFSLQNRVKLFLGIKRGTPLQDPTHINHFTTKEFRGLLEKRFKSVELRSIVTNRYGLFAKVFPFLFAHDILFYAQK